MAKTLASRSRMGECAGSLPGGVFWVLPHLESRFLGTRGMTAPERPGLARACQSWHELAQAFQQRELVVAADLLFVQRASISSKGVRLGASFLMRLTVLCTAGKPLQQRRAGCCCKTIVRTASKHPQQGESRVFAQGASLVGIGSPHCANSFV